MVESPGWLAVHGREAEAKRVLAVTLIGSVGALNARTRDDPALVDSNKSVSGLPSGEFLVEAQHLRTHTAFSGLGRE